MSFCTLNLIFFILNKHSQYLKCKLFYWHVVMMTFFGHSGHISNRYPVKFCDQPTIGNLKPNQQWMIFSGLRSSFPEEIIGGWNRLIVVMYAGCLNKDSVMFEMTKYEEKCPLLQLLEYLQRKPLKKFYEKFICKGINSIPPPSLKGKK